MFISHILLLVTGMHADPNYQYVIAEGGLNLRESPDQNSKILLKIPDSHKVEILNEEDSLPITEINYIPGKWIRIKYQEYSGYVFNSFLLPIKPPRVNFSNLSVYLSNNLNKISTNKYLSRIGSHYDEKEKIYFDKIIFSNQIIFTSGYNGGEGLIECIEGNYFSTVNYYQIARRYWKFRKLNTLFPFGSLYNEIKYSITKNNVRLDKISHFLYVENKKERKIEGISIWPKDIEESPYYWFTLINEPINMLCINNSV